MVVWNSMWLKIIIIPLGVVKQHVCFIRLVFYLFNYNLRITHHYPETPDYIMRFFLFNYLSVMRRLVKYVFILNRLTIFALKSDRFNIACIIKSNF